MYKTWLKTYHICFEKQPTFKINIYIKKNMVVFSNGYKKIRNYFQ